jgi:hypothetical protein
MAAAISLSPKWERSRNGIVDPPHLGRLARLHEAGWYMMPLVSDPELSTLAWTN